MDEYTRGFEALKVMRTLQWKPHLGLVDLEVELADRTLSLSVSPAQATAIMHFQDKGICLKMLIILLIKMVVIINFLLKLLHNYHFIFSDRWTLEDLSSVMHVPPGLLKRRLGFWISQGVLKEECTDIFVVVEKQKGQQRLPGTLNCRSSSGLLKGRESGSRKLFSLALP